MIPRPHQHLRRATERWSPPLTQPHAPLLLSQSERILEAMSAAIGISGGSVADELSRMQEALAAAALALEEAKAEARREMAAVVAAFGREMAEVENEFEEWRADAWGEAAEGQRLHGQPRKHTHTWADNSLPFLQ